MATEVKSRTKTVRCNTDMVHLSFAGQRISSTASSEKSTSIKLFAQPWANVRRGNVDLRIAMDGDGARRELRTQPAARPTLERLVLACAFEPPVLPGMLDQLDPCL